MSSTFSLHTPPPPSFIPPSKGFQVEAVISPKKNGSKCLWGKKDKEKKLNTK